MAFKVGSNSRAVIPDDKVIRYDETSLRGFDQYLVKYDTAFGLNALDVRNMFSDGDIKWVGDRWRAADTVNNYGVFADEITYLPLFGDGKFSSDVYSKSNCRRWYITGMGLNGSWSSNYYLRFRLFNSNYVSGALQKDNVDQTAQMETVLRQSSGTFADRTSLTSTAIFPIGTVSNASVLYGGYGALHGVITAYGQYGNIDRTDLSGPTDSDSNALEADCKGVRLTWEIVHKDALGNYHFTHGTTNYDFGAVGQKPARWLGIDTANGSGNTLNIFGHSYDLVTAKY